MDPNPFGYQRKLNPFVMQGGERKEKVIWVLDSGCSRHMTGDRALLTDVVKKAGPSVTFGDNGKGSTTGYGVLKVGNVVIPEVSLVDGLKHNLLNISQFMDKGYRVEFVKDSCTISGIKDGNVALREVRKRNLFIADLDSSCQGEANCFYSKTSTEESWLWHKKLSHLFFKMANSCVKRKVSGTLCC